MKTNELNNGNKFVNITKEDYSKPSIAVEEMELQWSYAQSGVDNQLSSEITCEGDCGCDE